MRWLATLFSIGVGCAFVWYAPPWPGEHGWPLLALAAACIAACVVTFRWAEDRPLLAQWLLIGGFMSAPLLAAWRLDDPSLVLLSLASPLLAAMLIGWPAGMATGALLTVLIAWLTQAGMLLLPISVSGGMLLLSAATCALIGWIIAHDLSETSMTSLAALSDAHRTVEHAREQQLLLRQVEEDLLLANREQRRLLLRLEAMNQIAEEARQTKQIFIANVSHELRTPLNMIIAYSELITQSPHLYGHVTAALLADIAVVQRNSHHLSRLVDDVLDLSQIETGRMALNKEWSSIDGIISTAVEAVRPLFQAKRLWLRTELDAGLPKLYCDQTRVRQVIINLLSNSGRFTETGGVSIHARHDDAHITLSITDTGPGIAEEDQPRLFEAFQQLDSSIRRKHGGSGLGLNISKHFVEMHKGRIWLESEVDVGTTFFIRLPQNSSSIAAGMSSDGQRWISPYHQHYPRTRQRVAKLPHVPRRYVVLDSGGTLQRLLKRYLDDAEIIAPDSIPEALSHLAETPAYAFIVNSASLPNGETISDIPNGLPFETPLFSCWLTGDDSLEGHSVVRYLVKPIHSEELLEAIDAIPTPTRTVLVADDEPELLRLFTRVLANAPEQYRVLKAVNGIEAMTLLRDSRPDALILDLVMPQMSGFDLLKAKEADPTIRSIPVIIVSSRDPNSQPIVSNQLVASRGSGLSMRDLLDCIESLTELLAPTASRGGRAPQAMPDE